MAADYTLKRNNLLPPVVVYARDAIGPVDLDGVTATFRMVNVLDGQAKVNAAASVAANIDFTADAATDTLTGNGHGLNDGESVTLKTSGVLPGALSTQREYFVVNANANTLQLAEILNGSPINITSAGSGTHTLLPGRITYEWIAGDTDTAGTFLAEVATIQGGKPLSFPNTGNLTIEVISELV